MTITVAIRIGQEIHSKFQERASKNQPCSSVLQFCRLEVRPNGMKSQGYGRLYAQAINQCMKSPLTEKVDYHTKAGCSKEHKKAHDRSMDQLILGC